MRVSLQGSRMRPTADATTVKIRDGELIITDGSYAVTREQVADHRHHRLAPGPRTRLPDGGRRTMVSPFLITRRSACSRCGIGGAGCWES
jgi:hypothetical protein